MKIRYSLLLGLALTLACPVPSLLADIIDDGEVVFKQCNVCHNITDDGTKKLGPNLGGVIGRKAGTLKGYGYSPAMATIGIIWNRETLDRFLTSPAVVVPATRMTFPGLKEATQRAAVIAFLEVQSES
ncbi:MAG: cytochrome c family protein [Magnetococcales bacterium]|nr:cytochrome c family protein [Magnetococcales bacterium]HIJ83292.1 cytochrome c family protein [Magnetococcales bacterium]